MKSALILMILLTLVGCIPHYRNTTYSPTLHLKHKPVKSAYQVIIQAIMEEGSLTEPKATILWDKYKRYKMPESKNNFADYLIIVNPNTLQDKYYIEFVERVKVRTKILKRGAYEK